MPKELEEKLIKQGKRKGYKGERLNAYVYGTLRRVDPSWEPNRAKKGGKARKV